MSSTIYLDHAAATPVDSGVLAAMQPYFTDQFYNPSATYLTAKNVRRVVEEARARTAKVLGARPSEIVFTAGATEANNLAIHGVMAKHPGKKLLVSAIEHASVLEAAKQYSHELIPVDDRGRINLEHLQQLLTDEVVLVSVMYVNNEIGTVNHPLTIGKLIKKVQQDRAQRGVITPLLFHSDAAQAPNYWPLFAKTFGLDLMSLNGGKIYGPKQSGALYVAAGIELEPLIRGGGQEFGLRSGTENVPSVVGFSFALEKAARLRVAEDKRMTTLQLSFMQEIAKLVPEVELTAWKGPLSPNFIHITVAGHDNERLMMELDERGIMCAVGSACSASKDEPSHVLKAIGLSDGQAQTSLRFSMGRSTTDKDVKHTVQVLTEVIHG